MICDLLVVQTNSHLQVLITLLGNLCMVKDFNRHIFDSEHSVEEVSKAIKSAGELQHEFSHLASNAIAIFSRVCVKCQVDVINKAGNRVPDPQKPFRYALISLITKEGGLSGDNVFVAKTDNLSQRGARMAAGFEKGRVCRNI